MKKSLIFCGAMALAVSALGFVLSNSKIIAKAEGTNGSTVAGLLTGAMDATNKTYTKKTQIFLNTEASSEVATHFHTGVIPSLTRTTYYDENAGALLMGDYDGSFTNINSGYRNSGTGVEHFTYTDTEAVETNLFSADHTAGDWTNDTQTVGGYYQTLTSLASVATDVNWETWNSYGYDFYKYTISETNVNDDAVLNAFQYFVAPLLLTDNYITYNGVWVVQATSFLAIRLYASTSDSGKSTVEAGDNDVLIAEARVYDGLSFTPETSIKFYSSADEWQEGTEMSYVFDAYNPEQYSLTTTVTVDQEFKICDGDTNIWYGYDDGILESNNFIVDADSSSENSNFKSAMAGEISLYWKPGLSSLYIGTNSGTVDVYFNVTISAAAGYGNGIYMVGDFTENTWKLYADYRLSWVSDTNWAGTFTLNIGQEYNFKFVIGTWSCTDGETAPTTWQSGYDNYLKVSGSTCALSQSYTVSW